MSRWSITTTKKRSSMLLKGLQAFLFIRRLCLFSFSLSSFHWLYLYPSGSSSRVSVSVSVSVSISISVSVSLPCHGLYISISLSLSFHPCRATLLFLFCRVLCCYWDLRKKLLKLCKAKTDSLGNPRADEKVKDKAQLPHKWP